MTMFNTQEEFEAYLAQQQAEVDADVAQRAEPPRREGFTAARLASLVLPVLGVIAVLLFVMNSKHDQQRSDDFWDGALGTTAWMTGREYNANADSLTERFTLRKKADAGDDR